MLALVFQLIVNDSPLAKVPPVYLGVSISPPSSKLLLGELMNIDSSSFCFRGGINTDVTDVTKSGLYIVDINSPNNPFPGYYSIACAFVSVNQSYKVIIACRNLPSSVKMWYKFESSNISGWFNIY